jgi:uroporphyrinogen-III synthase
VRILAVAVMSDAQADREMPVGPKVSVFVHNCKHEKNERIVNLRNPGMRAKVSLSPGIRLLRMDRPTRRNYCFLKVTRVSASAIASDRGLKPESPLLSSTSMPGFNGLRVLSFESRRAKEIAQLITNHGGQPMVAPSTREVPAGANEEIRRFLRELIEGRFDAVVLMTGVGSRALIETAETCYTRQELLAALARTPVIVRGPKPAAVMREFKVPIALTVPEPNTWREIVKALDAIPDTLPLSEKTIAVQEHGEPSPQLYEALRQRGADVFPVRVYRWELPEQTGPLMAAIQALIRGELDVVMFTSSVQFVHALRIAEELGLKDQLIRALNRSVVASIGPIASETLRKNAVSVDFEPSHPKMGFLVKEVAEQSSELIRRKFGSENQSSAAR